MCENSRYLKSIADDSVIVCDEIINVMNNVSTNVTNTISTNLTNTIPTNVTSTILMNYYEVYLDMFLLVTILLFMIVNICYHYEKHKSKQKNTGTLAK